MSCSVRIVDLNYNSSVPVNTWTKVDYTYRVDSLPEFNLGVVVVKNDSPHRFRIRHRFGEQWLNPGQEVVVDARGLGTYDGSFELLFESTGRHWITVAVGCEHQGSGAIQYTERRVFYIDVTPSATPSCGVRIERLSYSSSVPVNTWTIVDYTYRVDSLPEFNLGVLVVRNDGPHRFRIRHRFGEQYLQPGEQVVIDANNVGTHSRYFDLFFETTGRHYITVLAGCEHQGSGAIQYTDQRTLYIDVTGPTPTPTPTPTPPPPPPPSPTPTPPPPPPPSPTPTPPPPPPPTPTPTPPPPPPPPPPPQEQGVPWWLWIIIGVTFAVVLIALVAVITTKRKEE